MNMQMQRRSHRIPRQRDDLRSNYWRKLRLEVLARDGWRCYLCKQPIDPAIRKPHPMSPSVDHIVGPQTGFDRRYLRAAHLGCNQRRGDPQRTTDPAPGMRTSW